MRKEAVTDLTTTVLPHGYVFTHIATEAVVAETIERLCEEGHTEVALVAIRLSYKVPEKNGRIRDHALNLAQQGTIHLLQDLRLLVRKTDHVFLQDYTMYFVLLAANLQGAEIVEERLWEALLWGMHSMGEQKLLRPEGASVGHGALPVPQTSPADLLSASQISSRSLGEREQRSARMEDGTQLEGLEGLPLLAKKLGIPYLTFLPPSPPQSALQVLSAGLAQELRCYPVGRERNMLTVAMLDPQDHQALERLHRETGLLIFPVLTHPEALDNALKQLG